jgi:hypothetical protein
VTAENSTLDIDKSGKDTFRGYNLVRDDTLKGNRSILPNILQTPVTNATSTTNPFLPRNKNLHETSSNIGIEAVSS